MSEETKTNEPKFAFRIADLVKGGEAFTPICSYEYLTSVQLCEKVSEVFRQIYADYQGCEFVLNQNDQRMYLNLYFNHRDYSNVKDMPCACTKDLKDESVESNATLRAMRARDSRLVNGDKYFLTEEGKAIAEYLVNLEFLHNKNGSVAWNKIVSEVSNVDSNGWGQQLTQVSYVDPVKLIKLIMDEDGLDSNDLVYRINICPSIPVVNPIGQNIGATIQMLKIDRVSSKETKILANKYNLNYNQGINII